MVVFKRGGVISPLLFNMGDKFAVPGAGPVAALAPVQHKFRNGIFDKLPADIDTQQNLHGIFAGRPLARQTVGCIDIGLMAAPGMHDMLQKFAAPGVGGFTTLLPIQYKLRQLLLNELVGDTVLLKLAAGMWVGLPVGLDRGFARLPGHWRAGLLVLRLRADRVSAWRPIVQCKIQVLDLAVSSAVQQE